MISTKATEKGSALKKKRSEDVLALVYLVATHELRLCWTSHRFRHNLPLRLFASFAHSCIDLESRRLEDLELFRSCDW